MHQSRRLTYAERLELEALPEAIEKLEAKVEALNEEMTKPDFFRRPGEEIASHRTTLKQAEEELEATYDRWQSLEERSV